VAPRRAQQEAGAREVGHLHEQLAHAARKDADGQRRIGGVDVARQAAARPAIIADVGDGGPEGSGEERFSAFRAPMPARPARPGEGTGTSRA